MNTGKSYLLLMIIGVSLGFGVFKITQKEEQPYLEQIQTLMDTQVAEDRSFDISQLEKIDNLVPVAFIGAGVAGASGSLAASRAGFKTALIGNSAKSLINSANLIENWPGRPKTTGKDVMGDLMLQAKYFGTTVIPQEAVEIDFDSWPYAITLDDGEVIHALSIVLTMGGSQRKPNIKGVKEYFGKGVGECTICDGPFEKGKTVTVVGSGDTAVDMALQVSKFAKKVFVVHKDDQMHAAQAGQDALQKQSNIEVLGNIVVLGIEGNGKRVTNIDVKNLTSNEVSQMPMDSIYFAIGFKPNSDLVKHALDVDKDGYVIVEADTMATSIPLVYAAGNIEDTMYHKGTTSSGRAMQAALQVIEELEKMGITKQKFAQLKKQVYSPKKEQSTSTHIKHVATLADLKLEMQQKPVMIVDFYSPQCPHCQALSPVLDKLAPGIKNNVIKVNILEAGPLADKYEINKLPTLVIFKKGQETKRESGISDMTRLMNFVNSGASELAQTQR